MDDRAPTPEPPGPTPEPPGPTREPPEAVTDAPAVRREPRPFIERLGMAAIAAVLAALFGAVAASAWVGGEVFLAAMGAIGCLMTLWVAGLTLVRG
jgi:hypothetical protein